MSNTFTASNKADNISTVLIEIRKELTAMSYHSYSSFGANDWQFNAVRKERQFSVIRDSTYCGTTNNERNYNVSCRQRWASTSLFIVIANHQWSRYTWERHDCTVTINDKWLCNGNDSCASSQTYTQTDGCKSSSSMCTFAHTSAVEWFILTENLCSECRSLADFWCRGCVDRVGGLAVSWIPTIILS